MSDREMAKETVIHLRRGFDIKLEGAAAKNIVQAPLSETVDVKPPDFRHLIPRLLVEPGAEVQAGQPLFYDKNFPEIQFCAPVSGIVREVVRGEKRRILAVRLLADKGGIQYRDFGKKSPATMDSAAIRQLLLDSGCWPYLIQRPFSIIPPPESQPTAIFISCFDSAPLAPDLGFVIAQEPENFITGLEALSRLGNCPVHLGLRADQHLDLPNEASHIRIHRFSGPHPAGNVGVQIHHIAPIRDANTPVWTLHPQNVIIIGRLFNEGRYRADRLIALTGTSIRKPEYFRVKSGQHIGTVLDDELLPDKHRIVEGNVLHGKKVGENAHLSFYTNHITVVPEGDQPEFLGWLMPGFRKLSLSRTFWSWLNPRRVYRLDTNTHGEPRAFVMSGQYEQVLPMDIMPVQLLKAILAKDIEMMEKLGIYELAEEDLALCEFVCTSKIDVQQILAQGLELMRLET